MKAVHRVNPASHANHARVIGLNAAQEAIVARARSARLKTVATIQRATLPTPHYKPCLIRRMLARRKMHPEPTTRKTGNQAAKNAAVTVMDANGAHVVTGVNGHRRTRNRRWMVFQPLRMRLT